MGRWEGGHRMSGGCCYRHHPCSPGCRSWAGRGRSERARHLEQAAAGRCHSSSSSNSSAGRGLTKPAGTAAAPAASSSGTHLIPAASSSATVRDSSASSSAWLAPVRIWSLCQRAFSAGNNHRQAGGRGKTVSRQAGRRAEEGGKDQGCRIQAAVLATHDARQPRTAAAAAAAQACQQQSHRSQTGCRASRERPLGVPGGSPAIHCRCCWATAHARLPPCCLPAAAVVAAPAAARAAGSAAAGCQTAATPPPPQHGTGSGWAGCGLQLLEGQGQGASGLRAGRAGGPHSFPSCPHQQGACCVDTPLLAAARMSHAPCKQRH